jgi:hypothetical protein
MTYGQRVIINNGFYGGEKGTLHKEGGWESTGFLGMGTPRCAAYYVKLELGEIIKFNVKDLTIL